MRGDEFRPLQLTVFVLVQSLEGGFRVLWFLGLATLGERWRGDERQANGHDKRHDTSSPDGLHCDVS